MEKEISEIIFNDKEKEEEIGSKNVSLRNLISNISVGDFVSKSN